MGQSLAFIRDAVALETARGKIVDVDKCCRNLAPLFPELSAEQIARKSSGLSALWAVAPPGAWTVICMHRARMQTRTMRQPVTRWSCYQPPARRAA